MDTKIRYSEIRLAPSSLAVVKAANQIIEEYEAQGYQLTLRQLYYQFVSRDFIPNSQREYKKLGSIINDARLAGLISWTAIVDRTRMLRANSHWSGPADIVAQAASQFQIDKWEGQANRVEVWIEKDALIGIVEDVCSSLDVAFFSCRGYTSQSEMWSAGMRLKRYAVKQSQKPIIIHLGDHDPSGIDMSRDIQDRLDLFAGTGIEVKRIALNMDQVDEYEPPPNPAKITDSRAAGYISRFGRESWELDALEPKVLSRLIQDTVEEYLDERKWTKSVNREKRFKRDLARIARTLKRPAGAR